MSSCEQTMILVSTRTGRTDRTRAWSRRDLSRRSIFVWATIILFSNHLLATVKGVVPISFAQLVFSLQSVGIFQYLAWYVILRLLGSSDPIPVARWQDFLITVAL